MNRFPLWKYVMLAVVVALATIYALPNAYKADPSIQITSNSRSATIDSELLAIVTKALDEAGITYFGEEIAEEGFAFVRLNAIDDQLSAQTAIKKAFQPMRAKGKRYVVALNQSATTPDWLLSFGATPMNLGLDLAGGVHFLLEVDTPKALADRLEDMYETIKKGIRDERLFNVDIKVEGMSFVITSSKEEYKEKLVELLKDKTPDLIRKTETNSDGSFTLFAQLSDRTIKEIEDHAVSQNLTTIRNRVNELGVSEPLVQRQGKNRIVVELPGVQDAAGAKKILGKTANLEFRMEAMPAALRSQKEKFEFYTEEERVQRGPKFLERRRIISGERVIDARSGYDDQSSSSKIDIKLDSDGGTLMNKATRNDVGRNMGVLFIDYYTETSEKMVNGEMVEVSTAKVDKKIINLATIRGPLGVQFQITGLDPKEASDVALLLRAGSLAAPMVFVEERTIGPSLGAENIKKGVLSVEIGLLLVLVFMLLYYRVFGFAANIALVMNMVLLTALMSFLGATLTLPGIAGIVLTVGMAVDANVLIFSRIKEEVKNGLPPQSAIHSGFERAFTTILDANLTTLIVAFILFAIGTGPIKGFAVTLSIGILTSMFTAIVGTRAVINLIYGGRKVNKLWI